MDITGRRALLPISRSDQGAINREVGGWFGPLQGAEADCSSELQVDTDGGKNRK